MHWRPVLAHAAQIGITDRSWTTCLTSFYMGLSHCLSRWPPPFFPRKSHRLSHRIWTNPKTGPWESGGRACPNPPWLRHCCLAAIWVMQYL